MNNQNYLIEKEYLSIQELSLLEELKNIHRGEYYQNEKKQI